MKQRVDPGTAKGYEVVQEAIGKIDEAIVDLATMSACSATLALMTPASTSSVLPLPFRARTPSKQLSADISTLDQDRPPKVRGNLAKVSSSCAAVAHKKMHWTVEDLSAPAMEIPPHD
jgi:hypothetical protein